ncbi:septal ring lytic transglycosylase RlpA family protein [Ramlibacter algicola]|uniref:Endolytic peptidoglycan transglycosylase RlpA n=1 Tax=Ramlibacter algicola TaxID=2795217 RepID=A0A934PXD0_9BURK|nr:septal ring lytic transglycosylase RlpA family protein [Ramlibacter algicola]MBK0392240.1 septal ring lytic transglycosylase RlpA family protein [Ramlibacter algicola]
MRRSPTPLLAALLAAFLAWPATAAPERQDARDPPAASAKKKAAPKVPKRQVGKASFYAKMFNGRKMANGKPMNPNDDNAASRTLPLGTKALVTNLENGKSTVVTIEDRGPYVGGRIVDLSPASAKDIGLEPKQGLATVEVVPLEVPQPDAGSVKVGDASTPP